MRYRWQFYPNQKCTTLHVDVELPLAFDWTSEKTSPDGKKLKAELEAIPGVLGAAIRERYEVSIERGLAFDWSEVCPVVLRVVREFLGIDEDEVMALANINTVAND